MIKKNFAEKLARKLAFFTQNNDNFPKWESYRWF
jgi:hypothetical protein